jgi:TfoX/Sxy family transcriptional regulator of competence genes
MASSPRDASHEARFADLIRAFADEPDVEVGGRRGFGRGTLQVGGRIFAMISHGRLVLKLPSSRVVELIASGAGEPFDAGKGKPLAEWVVLGDADDTTWDDIAREAAAFVRGA